MRQKRNQAIYEGRGFISTTEARQRLVSSVQYLAAISESILQNNLKIKLSFQRSRSPIH